MQFAVHMFLKSTKDPVYAGTLRASTPKNSNTGFPAKDRSVCNLLDSAATMNP